MAGDTIGKPPVTCHLSPVTWLTNPAIGADLSTQTTFPVSASPMGVAFHPDGRTALVSNHGAGKITVVDLEAAAPLREFEAGVGVETLAFY